MPKLTPERLAGKLKRAKVTNVQFGEYLGVYVNYKKYDCTYVRNLLNGRWAGWADEYMVMVLEMKLKKFLKTYKKTLDTAHK